VLLERAQQLGGVAGDDAGGLALTPAGVISRRHGIPLAVIAQWRTLLGAASAARAGPLAAATLMALAVPTALILGERRPVWGIGARRHLAAQLREEGGLGTCLAEPVEAGSLAPVGSVHTLAMLLQEGASSTLATRLEIPAGSWSELCRSAGRCLLALGEIADLGGNSDLSLFASRAASSLRPDSDGLAKPNSATGRSVIPVETRLAKPAPGPVLQIVRDSAGVVYYLGKAFTLRPLQFALLSLLAERPGEGMAYPRLMARLYTNGMAEQQQLQYHRKGIERALLGRVDGSLIEVRPGIGMALRLEPGEVAFLGKGTLAEDIGGAPPLGEVVA
jgi:hypothetical protein